MLDIALTEEKQLKNQCKEILETIDSQEINQISLELFPIKTTSDTIELLFKNMSSYYQLKLEKKISFDDITNQILKKTKDKGKKLYEAFVHLFKSEFMQKFKKRILKAKGLLQKVNGTKLSQQIQPTDNTLRKVIAFGTNHEETKSSRQTPKEHLKTNFTKDIIKSISSDSASQKKMPTTPYLKDIKRPPLRLAVNSTVQNQNNNVVSESGIVANLSDQVMCFCGKHVSLIEKSKELSFQCYYCKKIYHRECMKRKEQSKICTFCHLKRLIPNKEVKRTLFVGLLHQGRKKHQIVLNLSEEDMSIQFKIQVRCFRIKEGCQNFILFPDACNFTIRNLVLKEFVPLHRQSSLKYRKDQPFYLSSGMHVKQNKILVTQKHPGKQSKDQRIVLDSHLIGIYIIEQKKVDWLIRQMRTKSFSTFTESKDLLELGFKRGNIGDQISCQIIKIPLTCSLSTQKLNIPARGLFCTHFQCFDLKNFLQLIAASTNPRWLCPLCKIPAFQFRIDIILHSILQLYKANGEASQIVFNRNGQFKVFSKDEKECVSSVQSIHDLPIQNKMKRLDSVKTGEQDVLIKKSKII